MLRTRRIGASILVALGVILLLLSSYGWWAQRYFLDSDRFTAKAGQILDQPEVAQALAIAITDEISEASGRDLQIARPFIATIVGEVVQSRQFQTVFDAAVLRLHRAIVGGGARDAVLDLSDVVDRVRNAIEPIAPNLAEEIPTGETLKVTILDRSQLDTIYDTTNLVEDVVVGLTIAAIVFLAGGVALSPRRWRTLALMGWVTLGVFVVSLVVVRVGRSVTGSFADRAEYSSAAETAYKVITRGLMVQGVVFAVLGLVVGLGGGWTDRHGGWAGVQHAFGRATTWIRAQVPKRAPAPTPEPTPVLAGAGLATDATPTTAAPTSEPAEARAVVEGILAPRLPEPRGRARVAHWWRAAGLAVLGLFAVFSPGSLTTVVVVLLGIAALYLAVTEAVAAWGTPRDPAEPDHAPGETASAPHETAVADPP